MFVTSVRRTIAERYKQHFLNDPLCVASTIPQTFERIVKPRNTTLFPFLFLVNDDPTTTSSLISHQTSSLFPENPSPNPRNARSTSPQPPLSIPLSQQTPHSHTMARASTASHRKESLSDYHNSLDPFAAASHTPHSLTPTQTGDFSSAPSHLVTRRDMSNSRSSHLTTASSSTAFVGNSNRSTASSAQRRTTSIEAKDPLEDMTDKELDAALNIGVDGAPLANSSSNLRGNSGPHLPYSAATAANIRVRCFTFHSLRCVSIYL